MATIHLSQGSFTTVDEEWYDYLMQWKWSYCKGYAIRRVKTEAGRKCIYMHRLVCGYDGPLDVDHINGKSLDNRRANLRLATRSQNLSNQRNRPNLCNYRGVVKDKSKWGAQITVNCKRIWLGTFDTPEKAALAFDQAAIAARGNFARLNFPELRRNGKEEAAA